MAEAIVIIECAVSDLSESDSDALPSVYLHWSKSRPLSFSPGCLSMRRGQQGQVSQLRAFL
jgi:hypothetical protein